MLLEYGKKHLCHTWVRVVNAESTGELCWDCEGSVDPAVRVHDTTGNAIHDAVDLVTNEPEIIWNPYHLGSRNVNLTLPTLPCQIEAPGGIKRSRVTL